MVSNRCVGLTSLPLLNLLTTELSQWCTVMGVDVDMMSSALYRGLVFYGYLVASLISLVHDACDEDVCGEPNSGAHSIYTHTPQVSQRRERRKLQHGSARSRRVPWSMTRQIQQTT